MPKTATNLISAELSSAAKRTAQNILTAVNMGNFAHSYILEGGSAASRLTLAAIVACSLVCENKNGIQPCFACSQCKKIIEDQHTDIKFLGGDGEDIKVDAIRNLSKDAYVMPTDCDFHIYILRDADRMNKNAQNALLKILEEPPSQTVFILLTASKEMLLPTVVSRAQSHSLGVSTNKEIADALMIKFPSVSPAIIEKAAKIQSVMDKIELDLSAIKALEAAFRIADEVFIERRMRINELLPKGKDELVLTFGVLAIASRDVAVFKKKPDAETFVFEHGGQIENASSGVSMRRAMDMYEAFSNAAERVKNSGNISSIVAELFAAIKK